MVLSSLVFTMDPLQILPTNQDYSMAFIGQKENQRKQRENQRKFQGQYRNFKTERKNSTKPNYHLLWWMIYATTRKSGLYKNPQKLGDSFSLFLFSTKPTESSRKNSRFHFFFFFSITHFFSFSKHNFFFLFHCIRNIPIYTYMYISVCLYYIYTHRSSVFLSIFCSAC